MENELAPFLLIEILGKNNKIVRLFSSSLSFVGDADFSF